jgi:hypothetical protein
MVVANLLVSYARSIHADINTSVLHSPLAEAHIILSVLCLILSRSSYRAHACSPREHNRNVTANEERWVLWAALEEVVNHRGACK